MAKSSQAQSVVASQAPTAPLTSEWQRSQVNEMDVFTEPGEASANTLPEFFRYGPLTLRPHVDYRFSYGNGIQSNPGLSTATALNEISPGIRFDLGTHWSIDYTPTFMFYSSSAFRNVVNQAVALTGGVDLNDWTLGLTHNSSFTTDPMVQTGTQTQQSDHQTTISANHAFTSHTSADFAVSQNINLITGFQNIYDWSTMDWLNYAFWPRLNAGLGAGAGYDKIDDVSPVPSTNGLNQAFEQLQARINWRATDKFSLQVNGGAQARQFQSPGTSSTLNPIYGANLQYQPFKTTQITLDGNRTVGASGYYLAAQQSIISTINLNVQQVFLKKYTLGCGVGFGRTEYGVASGAAVAGPVNRTDNDVSFNLSLSHPFLKRGTWTVFYQYMDNHSTVAGYSFTSNQTGLQLSYTY